MVQRWIVGIAFTLLASNLRAQDTTVVAFTTEARVHLHTDATDNSSVIRTRRNKSSLQVIHPGAFKNDFYHVVPNGDTGWVAFPFVRRASESFTTNTFTTNTDTHIDGEANPADEVDPDWAKPGLRRSVLVASDGSRCEAEGAPDGDWRTNIRKNRIDAPKASPALTWEALADTLNLPFA